ncbi:Alpha trehalose-phosphate synthase [Spraguea lophii 42_110]|uniref:Alpha trehalose-phosphate synthase n=1 Tax=Spraguea lophii (strain 42_110) TaxID=1358809 RepID=S7WDI8_SPRLO|nr:Alpha trehalose-phosphate synthase [Spraguea lophii 42_110]
MKIIVISNRLPITVKREKNGFKYIQNSGGLVTGLLCVRENMEFTWVGNISGNFTDEEKEKITSDGWKQFKSWPVFINTEMNKKAYSGVCNRNLWPILHQFSEELIFKQDDWENYVEYNRIFCKKVMEIASENDVIWVHDYHLMLLPRMIKEGMEYKAKVGFFLHTPFPRSEVFKRYPYYTEIVTGLLHSDLLGFHIFEYVTGFMNTAKEFIENKEYKKDVNILNSVYDLCRDPNENKFTLSKIDIGTHTIKLSAISIGIDPSIFTKCLKTSETIKRIKELKEKYKDKKIILGVDRNEYTKGIPHRMRGFEEFLERNPEMVGKIVFLQITVPSRMDILEYSNLRLALNKNCGDINGKFGNVDETFFYLLNKSIPFPELCALYAISDICLITPLIDGMNLVSLEYVACQENNNGVLILSEHTGSTSTLPGALIINSWDQSTIADALEQAMDMDEEEKLKRCKINYENVQKFTALKWAKDNIENLNEI